LEKQIHRRGTGREKKIPFRKIQQLQVLDFVQAEFAILMIFGFFLMTTEFAWFDRLTTSGILSRVS